MVYFIFCLNAFFEMFPNFYTLLCFFSNSFHVYWLNFTFLSISVFCYQNLFWSNFKWFFLFVLWLKSFSFLLEFVWFVFLLSLFIYFDLSISRSCYFHSLFCGTNIFNSNVAFKFYSKIQTTIFTRLFSYFSPTTMLNLLKLPNQ